MGWRDLLQKPGGEEITAPWVGGCLQAPGHQWRLETHPPEVGWHLFRVDRARRAWWVRSAERAPEHLAPGGCGYLVGDLFVSQEVAGYQDPSNLAKTFPRVYLIERGLERFTRVSVGRFTEGGPLVFAQAEFPAGPEPEVLQAYLGRGTSLEAIPGVPPALELAFRMESHWRVEIEERRRKEQERREAEERQRRIVERLGDGAGRREVARTDFGEAAKAALAVGGAEYMDHRPAYQPHEMVVRFRMNRRRFSCICDARTLQILDAGICLQGSDGIRGDQLFTLESLPSVIQQAERSHVLVVTRHEDDDGHRIEDEDSWE